MKLKLKITVGALFLFLLSVKTFALVGSYTFNQYSGTYTSIKGGTILLSGSYNTFISYPVTIPSFTYNGKAYTSITITTEGYLFFGQMAPYYEYSPIRNKREWEGVICAFAAKLSSASAGNTEIRYQIIGNEIIVQWQDVARDQSVGERISFQIRLNTSDNSIKFVYGGTIVAGTGSFNLQVGLGGKNNNDFNCREVTLSDNWGASKLGKYNSSTCYFNSAYPNIKPTAGLTYKYTYNSIKNNCQDNSDNTFSFYHYAHQNDIWCMAEDGNYIWAGTSGGVFKLNKTNGALVASFNMNNGLGDLRTPAIALDFQGNKWFCGENAVTKFDGNSFTIYNWGNTGHIPLDGLRSMVIDLNGAKWFARFGTLIKFDNINWTVYNQSNSPLPAITMLSMAVDAHNNIWLGTDTAGVFKFDGTNWINYNTQNSGIASNTVSAIAVGNNDSIWFGSWDYPKTAAGVSCFNGKNWTIFNTYNSGLANNNIHSIYIGKNGTKWISHYGCSISKYNGLTWKVYNGINGCGVGTVIEDVQGNIWLGSSTGISKMSNNLWLQYYQSSDISGNEVTGIAIDSNNVKWFSTHNGVTKYNDTIWTNYSYGSAPTGLPDVSQQCITIDKSGNKWMGSFRGYVTKLDASGFTVYHPCTGNIQCIVSDNLNNIWIGTETEGMMMFNGSSWTTYNTGNSSLSSNNVTGIAIDAGGVKWISTNGKGVCKFTGSVWNNYNTLNSGLLSDNVYCAFIDKTGNKWFGTSWGAFKFDGTNWIQFRPTNSGLIDNVVRTINQDLYGCIWFGTVAGFSKFDGTANWASYNLSDGMANVNIQSINFDQNGYPWLGTLGGTTRCLYKTPVADFASQTSCYPDDTYLFSTSCNTDLTSSFQWDVNADNITDYTSKYIIHHFPNYGIYPVKLTVVNGNRTNIITKNVTVGLRPQIDVTPSGNNFICIGQTKKLSTSISNYNSIFTYKYNWSNGDSTSSINVSKSGIYRAIVGINECLSQPDSSNVTVLSPYDSAQICLVSVDPVTRKNMIVWERNSTNRIASYNIYKLFGSTYIPIGNIPYKDLSVFIDYTSNPETSAARYAISVIDTCGNESDKSPYHQTINLGASQGTKPNTAVLDWTDYIDQSGNFKPDWYYIFKGKTPAGLKLYDSISSIFTEWNDTNVAGAQFYKVSCVKPSKCYPAIFRAQTSSGPYSQSVSNLKDYSLQSVQYLEVYPSMQTITYMNGSSATFNVSTNLDSFDVKCPENWLTLSKNVFAKFFIATATQTSTYRSAKITVSGIGVNSKEVELIQGDPNSIGDITSDPIIQIYPNPFSDETNISLSLLKAGWIKADIFNVLGKKVKQLTEQNMLPGKYQFKIKLSSDQNDKGIYFLKVESNNKVFIHKLTKVN